MIFALKPVVAEHGSNSISINYSESIGKLLQYKSSCSKQALRNLLEVCVKYGPDQVDPKLTRLVATKLAICEFENSNILYPLSCNQLESSLDLCILELEKSPQFWTTFSGYYQEIPRICHEASIPFQKDHIVDLYSNVTKIYEQLLQDYRQSQEWNHHIQDQFAQKFEDIFSYLNCNFKQYQQSSDEYFHQWYQNIKFENSNALKSMETAFNNLQAHIDDIDTQIFNFQLNFHKFQSIIDNWNLDTTIENMKSQYLDDLIKVGDTSSHLVNQILQQMEGLDIVTIKNSENIDKLSAKLHENNQYANDISVVLKDNQDLLQNQSFLVSRLADDFIKTFSSIYQSNMDQFLTETFSKMGIMLNRTIKDFETKLNTTALQLDSINQNMNMLKMTTNHVTSFINATSIAIANSKLNLISMLKAPFNLLNSIISPYLQHLFYIPNMVLTSILVVTTLFYIGKIFKLVKTIGFKIILQYISFIVFLSLGVVSAVTVKNLFVALHQSLVD